MTELNSAARNEAEEVETVTVEWRGLQISGPASIEDWPASAYYALRDGKPAPDVLWQLLGADVMAEVLATDPTPTVGDLGDLSALIAKAMGFGSTGE